MKQSQGQKLKQSKFPKMKMSNQALGSGCLIQLLKGVKTNNYDYDYEIGDSEQLSTESFQKRIFAMAQMALLQQNYLWKQKGPSTWLSVSRDAMRKQRGYESLNYSFSLIIVSLQPSTAVRLASLSRTVRAAYRNDQQYLGLESDVAAFRDHFSRAT